MLIIFHQILSMAGILISLMDIFVWKNKSAYYFSHSGESSKALFPQKFYASSFCVKLMSISDVTNNEIVKLDEGYITL